MTTIRHRFPLVNGANCLNRSTRRAAMAHFLDVLDALLAADAKSDATPIQARLIRTRLVPGLGEIRRALRHSGILPELHIPGEGDDLNDLKEVHK